ncbi:uncharacterized protein G2W53_000913 [Senna tora]|uniref:Uncharacterized protein n=1 Tax=Senna tora TaxID=362788 RepID=A0A834XG94_9FABA|nr:uncharacterized protein G2W53_000913 [Senna tora]
MGMKLKSGMGGLKKSGGWVNGWKEIGVWVERRGVSVFGGVGYGIGKGMEDWKGWRGGSRFEGGGVVQFWGRLERGWGLGFGLREGEWFGFGEGCEGGWVTVLVRKRDTVWWGFGCCERGKGMVLGWERDTVWWGFGCCERGKGMVLGWKRDTVWWGCYGGVAMEVEVVGKKKKRLERERGQFWGERRKKGF